MLLSAVTVTKAIEVAHLVGCVATTILQQAMPGNQRGGGGGNTKTNDSWRCTYHVDLRHHVDAGDVYVHPHRHRRTCGRRGRINAKHPPNRGNPPKSRDARAGSLSAPPSPKLASNDVNFIYFNAMD